MSKTVNYMDLESRFVNDHCPACRSAVIRPLHGIAQLPAILFPVDEAHRNSIISQDIDLAECDACEHIFIRNVSLLLNERIYREYYQFYPFARLETMNAPYRRRFETVFNAFQPESPARLLEIGCDSREQMLFFLNRGLTCSAISPGAKPGADIEFHDGFYETTPLPAKYDVIVSRFNLEHVVDAGRFLGKINSDSAKRARIYFQVPNARFFLQSGYLNVFAHEHIHYFSERSLRAMLETHGFEIELLTGRDEPSLLAVCRIGEGKFTPGSYIDSAQSAIAEARRIISSVAGHQVVFYGCGLPLTALLYCGNQSVALPPGALLLDDNPVLAGRYMPNTDLRVQAFDPSLIKQDAIILLTASQLYHAAMISKIPRRNGIKVYAFESDCVREIVPAQAR